MLNNKKENMTPFDMKEAPKQIPKYLLPFIWGGSYIMTRPLNLKIKKIGMKGVKGPFLVLSTHQGFSDYYIAPLALFPRKVNYVSDMEGFAAFGKWIYRSIGCIGKRRYVPDVTVIQNIGKCFEMGNPVVVFPESRHSNVGTTSLIPDNMGRLAKHFAKKYDTPLAILSVHGSYLTNPFWDEEHTRRGKMEAKIEMVYTADELKKQDEGEIQKTIEEKLSYNEYSWQNDERVLFKGKNLAEGLHRPLYQCRECGRKYKMISKGDYIGCTSCKKVWKLYPWGVLKDKNANSFDISEWYEWERTNVEKQIEIGASLRRKYTVQIEALPNEHGFVKLGEGNLYLDREGFSITFPLKKKYNYTPKDWKIKEWGGKKVVTITYPHALRESVQTEYNYRNKGMAIVLSNQDMTYYLYSKDKEFNVTELQFISERLTNIWKQEKH